MEEEPIFRASKKRKLGRQKYATNEKETGVASTANSLHKKQSSEYDSNTDTENGSDGGRNISSVIKSRRQKTRSGVQFSNSKSVKADETQAMTSMDLTQLSEPMDDPLRDMSSRFTTSTGQVVDVDLHMMEYIDSQIAKRKALISDRAQAPSSLSTRRMGLSSDDNENSSQSDNEPHDIASTTQRKPSTVSQNTPQTHLFEVSLANLPTLKPQGQPRRRKPRLNRDGKPFRPRILRQNSADQARDRLVEQILSENSLQTETTPPAVHTRGGNEDADEKMAAEFQREFMESVAERQARMIPSKKVATNAEGPKLGGGRSARAKMQASMTDKDKDAAKK